MTEEGNENKKAPEVPDPLPDALVRRFLHRLKKIQVDESLDRLHLQRSNATLYVPPTTQRQMELVRSFFSHVILSSLELVVDDLKEEDKKEDTTPEEPADGPQAATETTAPGHIVD